ncbi:MAG: succinate--CoA ligase subunit alpha [Betaproteobacteria bacterium]|nr:succinate--CoA ligase subunit alpha [Betaproteobacteria bacterium]
MSILIGSETRVLVQGATGAQARFDIRYCLDYGTVIVAGVTPGRGGESVEGVSVFNTVAAAVAATGANASAVYVPARGVKDAVHEAVEAGIGVLACFAENVPRHDAASAVAVARAAGVRMAGFNTNGMISPGRCKLGGIGGDRAAQVYAPGRIGVCSRSGGMSAEICWTLSRAGLGASTCISMGGDPIVGMRMAEVLRLFEADPETDACVIFGEPGGSHEIEVAEALRAGEIAKPVVALIAGQFQENYPAGVSFGHFSAMIRGDNDSASAKRRILSAAGARVAASLEEIPGLLRRG